MEENVPAADVIRLIEAHLTEAGLHEASRALRQESGIGAAGVFHGNFGFWASGGQWHLVLESLNSLDQKRVHLDPDLVAEVHEMAILELAEANEMELAYSLYRIVQTKLENSMSNIKIGGQLASRARILEQKLASLASIRQKNPNEKLLKDFYPGNNKQEIRNDLGERLDRAIPRQPNNRLTTLIQQSIKWQTHTGQIPKIKQWWEETGQKRKREFDLVLGTTSSKQKAQSEDKSEDVLVEPLPRDPYSVVKLGKHATAEAAVFLPDGSGLVTGSSDGLIEIWDPAHNYSKLRLDLPYQQKEELLGHDTSIAALVVSKDGTMLASAAGIALNVWRMDTGKCLRSIKTSEGDNKVTCLDFSPDASHVLVGSQDGVTREFGLRSGRIMKEFQGHTSYVSACLYHVNPDHSYVVSSSGDGTIRIFDTKTSDCLRLMRPNAMGKTISDVGSSLIIDSVAEISADCPNIHTVVPLYSPTGSILVVPRGPRAFLVNFAGVVIRIFDSDKSDAIFVAATVSPSNRWLYAVRDDGVCCIFHMSTGELETSILDFASQSSTKSKDSTSGKAEITSIIHHPNKTIIGAFSNDKGQKKGMMMLWK